MNAKSLQSCLTVTLWTIARQASLSMGFSRQELLEWVAMPPSRGSSWLRDRTGIFCVSRVAGEFFTTSATWEAHFIQNSFPFVLFFRLPPWYPHTSSVGLFSLIFSKRGRGPRTTLSNKVGENRNEQNLVHLRTCHLEVPHLGCCSGFMMDFRGVCDIFLRWVVSKGPVIQKLLRTTVLLFVER